MFSKAFLVAFLYLSVVSSVLARPTANDFQAQNLKKGSSKANTNTEQCGVSFFGSRRVDAWY